MDKDLILSEEKFRIHGEWFMIKYNLDVNLNDYEVMKIGLAS